MKMYKYLTLIAIAILITGNLNAQSKKQRREAQVKSWVENKNFVFQAQYANPLGGGHRYLNYDYDLRIKPDSVISYLPYFGQVTFDPPIYPTDDGIKFKSTKYSYKMTTKKNGSYVIIIEPKDAKYIQRLYLTIFTNGSANLDFNITNRTSINYDGYITGSNKDNNANNNTKNAAVR